MFDELQELDAQITRIEEALIAAPRPFKQGRNVARNAIKERPWWKQELHPRGRDGRFIQNGGYVRGDFKIPGANGEAPVNVKLAQVKAIVANPNDPNDPLLQISTGDGRHTGYVRASEATDAPDVKARLDGMAAETRGDDEEVPDEPVDEGGPAPKPKAQQIAPTARSNDEDVEEDTQTSASEYADQIKANIAKSQGLPEDDPQVVQLARMVLEAIVSDESIDAETRQKAQAALESLAE